ncbi:hypothetical protein MTO96_032995 [Rhipicephalus appendiculatus]
MLKELTEGLRIPQVVRSAQGVAVSGEEALLMTLRRLPYPNRWYDIEPLFGRASYTMSSIVSEVMAHIDRAFGHLLDDLTTRHMAYTWRPQRVLLGILGESGLYRKLQCLTRRCLYCIYGDPAYPLRPLLIRPYGGATLTDTEEQQLFNEGMSTVRQAVEWGFGKVIAEFAFLDFEKKQKILLQNFGVRRELEHVKSGGRLVSSLE